MDSTGPEFDLPCPTGDDYAALPLYVQRLAEQIEAEHVALRGRIEAATRPKTAIWRRSTIATSGSIEFGFSAGDLIFSNYTDPDSGAPPALTSFGHIFPQAGMWQLGWHATTTPTGAITAGSLRIMHVGVTRQDFTGASVTILADVSRHTVTVNVGAGVDHFGSTNTFLVPFDSDRVTVTFRFEHGNVASTVAITSITAWVRYVGSIDPIEVVT